MSAAETDAAHRLNEPVEETRRALDAVWTTLSEFIALPSRPERTSLQCAATIEAIRRLGARARVADLSTDDISRLTYLLARSGEAAISDRDDHREYSKLLMGALVSRHGSVPGTCVYRLTEPGRAALREALRLTFRRIVFTPKKVHDEWRLRVEWPGGGLEYITGFQTESEAEDWILSPEARTWAKARGCSDF